VTSYSDAFDRREPFTIEYRLRRYDGVYRWVVDSGLPRFDSDGDFLGYIGSAVDITDQKVAQATLSSLSGRLMEAQEQERSWIARELHDDVGQRTAALTMQVHFLIESFTKGSLNRYQVESFYAQMRELVTRVQAISRRLHPAVLDYDGLSTAASRLCRDLSGQHGVEIAFHAGDLPSDLPSDIALALFRVLQEGLNNAIKHSSRAVPNWRRQLSHVVQAFRPALPSISRSMARGSIASDRRPASGRISACGHTDCRRRRECRSSPR